MAAEAGGTVDGRTVTHEALGLGTGTMGSLDAFESGHSEMTT